MFSPQTLENSAGSSQLNLDYRQDLEKLTSLCKDLNPSSTQGKKKLQASHREYLQDEITSLEKKLKETNSMNRNLKEQLSVKEHELEVFFNFFFVMSSFFFILTLKITNIFQNERNSRHK